MHINDLIAELEKIREDHGEVQVALARHEHPKDHDKAFRVGPYLAGIEEPDFEVVEIRRNQIEPGHRDTLEPGRTLLIW